MKGWVTLTDDDIDLFSKAIEVIDNLTPEYVTDYEYRWLGKWSIKYGKIHRYGIVLDITLKTN